MRDTNCWLARSVKFPSSFSRLYRDATARFVTHCQRWTSQPLFGPAQPWVGLGHRGLSKLAEVVFAEAVHPDEVGGAFRGWGGSCHDDQQIAGLVALDG